MKNATLGFVLLGTFLVFLSCKNIPLFDGETLNGWEGSETVFRVDKGIIKGGNLNGLIAKSEYLCTQNKYGDFELKLSAKFLTDYLKINGGISFRAKRVPNSNEVMGYQADIGYIDASVIPLFSNVTPKDTTGLYPLWGSLVDENRPDTSRYPKPEIFPVIIYEVADEELMNNLVKPKDWNDVFIKVSGPNIEIKINGVTTATYAEQGNVPSEGCICLQVHAGEPYEVWYKDIRLKPLR